MGLNHPVAKGQPFFSGPNATLPRTEDQSALVPFMNACRNKFLHKGGVTSSSSEMIVSRRLPKKSRHPSSRQFPRPTQDSGFMGRSETADSLRKLRDTLNLPRPVFARLMGCSERALANWESGRTLPGIYGCRLSELQNLYRELFKTLDPQAIATWMTTPNDQFDRLKPLELIERGETFRIWRMLYLPPHKLLP